MLTIFNRRKVAKVETNEALFAIKQRLKENGIPHRVKVREQFCNSFNRGAGMEALAREYYWYIIYVENKDYERAEAVIQDLKKTEGAEGC